MKKSNLFQKICWSLLALSIMTTVLTACSKDEKYPDTLTGTVWRGVINEPNKSFSLEISFVSGDRVNRHFIGETGEDEEFLYTYSNPNVIIFYDEGKVEGFTAGNKLTINDNGEIIIFDRIK